MMDDEVNPNERAAMRELAATRAVGFSSGGERTLTRLEVLTVLRAQRASVLHDTTPPHMVVSDLITIFERME